jgi:diaminohydroxyphosphoribosylaminopyrimidine deaminase / 5-amino-6-(5-phosphoribosylamino)uracil reductase
LSHPVSETAAARAGAAEERVARAWAMLRAAARAARGEMPSTRTRFAFDRDGRLSAQAGAGPAVLEWHPDRGWAALGVSRPELAALCDLYLPICSATAEAPLAVGHLGQSIDGYIATGSGDSYYVTGPENIVHLHRMRALCDAVVVGAATIRDDDPRLTARLAEGENPVRVVLDPARRLERTRSVFVDGAAPTLLVCDEARIDAGEDRVGEAELVGVPCLAGRLDLAAVVSRLRARGLNAIFIEGGGLTVSGFLEAGLLDRLHVAIAPLVIGRGRPGLRLPASEPLAACLRPAHRAFAMGADVLFDCDLRVPGGVQKRPTTAGGDLRRIY